MFAVELDEETHSLRVKDDEMIIAEGAFGVDPPDGTVLVLFTKITIMPNDYDQLDKLLSTIDFYLGKSNNSRVFTRFPMFDGQFDIDQLQIKHPSECLMVTSIAHVKYYDFVQFDREQYELVTNKQLILTHSQMIAHMMRENAFWAKKWNDQEIQDRVKSASGVVMILDKRNNNPCGFGRIFIVSTTEECEAKFAYMTDITVGSEYQTQGLGFALTNTLLGMFIDENSKRCAHGSICLFCSDEGVGAIASPKLYKKSGFELFDETDNRMALIHTEQFSKYASS